MIFVEIKGPRIKEPRKIDLEFWRKYLQSTLIKLLFSVNILHFNSIVKPKAKNNRKLFFLKPNNLKYKIHFDTKKDF